MLISTGEMKRSYASRTINAAITINETPFIKATRPNPVVTKSGFGIRRPSGQPKGKPTHPQCEGIRKDVSGIGEKRQTVRNKATYDFK